MSAARLAVALWLLAVASAHGAEDAARGEQIVKNRCMSCHALAPTATRDPLEAALEKGPSLAYAGSRLKAEWLRNWLVTPSRIRPAGHPATRCVVGSDAGDRIDVACLKPHEKLTSDDAVAVTAYLQTLRGDINPFPQAAEKVSTIAGRVHFGNLLPCGACHRTSDGRGGVSGPALVDLAARSEREWVGAFVSDPRHWSSRLMPSTTLRADQLAAMVDYMFEPTSSAPLSLPSPTTTRPPPAPRTRAERLYRHLCSQCHGVQADGRGINAPFMFVQPRNHSSAQEMAMLTEESVRSAIRNGGTAVGKSALMPSWAGVLDDADIDLLARYVLGLSRKEVGHAQP